MGFRSPMVGILAILGHGAITSNVALCLVVVVLVMVMAYSLVVLIALLVLVRSFRSVLMKVHIVAIIRCQTAGYCLVLVLGIGLLSLVLAS